MRIAFPSALLLIATAACSTSPRVVPPTDGATIAALQAKVSEMSRSVAVNDFEAATFTTSNGTTIPYRLLRPSNVEPGRTYPLVVIFHGSGAIGTDNVSQVGPYAKSWATPLMRERYPAFVLVPQFSSRSAVYTGTGAATTSQPTDLLREALVAIEDVKRTLPIDPRRVYAVGFSMGGSAVWSSLVLRPDLFSAAVSVAGVPTPELRTLGRTRLLLVHGDADDENPFDAALAAHEALAPRQVEFWRYEGLGHEFPLDLLVGTGIAEWLFRE
jgi:predicted peptidase